MSQCGDYEDINFYVINVFYGIVIAVYFLPFKKNHPVGMCPNKLIEVMKYSQSNNHLGIKPKMIFFLICTGGFRSRFFFFGGGGRFGRGTQAKVGTPETKNSTSLDHYFLERPKFSKFTFEKRNKNK